MRARLQEARARLAHSGNKGASVEAAFRKLLGVGRQAYGA